MQNGAARVVLLCNKSEKPYSSTRKITSLKALPSPCRELCIEHLVLSFTTPQPFLTRKHASRFLHHGCFTALMWHKRPLASQNGCNRVVAACICDACSISDLTTSSAACLLAAFAWSTKACSAMALHSEGFDLLLALLASMRGPWLLLKRVTFGGWERRVNSKHLCHLFTTQGKQANGKLILVLFREFSIIAWPCLKLPLPKYRLFFARRRACNSRAKIGRISVTPGRYQ